MRVLIVHHDEASVAALQSALRARNSKVMLERTPSVVDVRARLEQGLFEVVLLPLGDEPVAHAGLVGTLQRLGARVLEYLGIEAPSTPARAPLEASANWDCATPVPGQAPGAGLAKGSAVSLVDRLGSGSAASVADQLLGVLGVARSQVADLEVLESLSSAGAADFSRVRWPGLDAPVLLVEARGESYDPASVAAAQKASLVRGPGLAETLEVFWDDPRPHLVQALPVGRSLARAWGRRPMGLPTALAVLRGLAEGVATLHSHGLASGGLEPESVWLTTEGEVLLLGHGVLHLRAVEGGWHWSAPEEEVARVAPELPGDPFRIGMMLMMLAVGDSPYGEEPIMRREWSLTQSEHLVELGPVVDLLETLLHLDSVDRPRGELLHRLLAEAAPVPWKAYVATVAKGQ